MTRLCHPLPPGAPVGLWRHSAVAEARFDVADRPMAGRMDPFFFLTKEKNFIPHEYPCRTGFAARFRDRRPEPAETGAADRAWLPFGAPRLDLSGFWFRPTRIAARAETLILTEAAGPARLRLATCGGAVVFVNGAEAGWLAPYVRNLEGEMEVSVSLRAGENAVTVVFDDLAERDTRFYIQLDYLDGPAARQAIPVACAPDVAEAVAATLEAMHFDRPSYDGGPVALVLPRPLPAPARLRARVEGDFMSHDDAPDLALDIAPGTDRIVLGEAEDLPADFRHFALVLEVEGFAASRTLGTEIVHAARLGPAPAALADRIDEALTEIAGRAEADTVRALARLALGDGGAETRAMIAAALPRIDDLWDCADFALVPLIWGRMRWGDVLGDDLRARVDDTILGYRYWMDEPGNDVQWYFSENHALLFHTAAYLAGTLHPGGRFVRSGRTGAEQARVGATRLREWLDHFERWEMAEFNSAPYFPIDLKGLTALYALAPDADIRDRAGRGIARLIEIVANSAHKGVLTGAQGRSYEHTLRAARSLELSAIGRLLWGKGAIGTRFHATPQLALCLRDHGLALPDLAARADWQGAEAQEWCFVQGEGGFAALYHYKTADFALGSAAAYRWYDWGYQETLIQARLGAAAQAQVWINHPGELIHSGYARPSYWGGSASIPRVQQYRDLAVVQFRGTAPQPGFTHAWFPRQAFDMAEVAGDTAWASAGAAHLVLRGSAAFESVKTGPTAGNELRLPGRDGLWLVRLGDRARHGDAADFAARFGLLSVASGADGSLVVDDPDYGIVRFEAGGAVAAEGRRLDPGRWTVAGDRRRLPRGPL